MNTGINENSKWQNSFTLKMAILAVIGLFLLVPLEMIKSIIRERQQNSEQINKEISLQWAGAQTLSGPVLNIPVLVKSGDKGETEQRNYFHILPESLNVTGKVETEKRHRSIYEAVVYTSDISMSGEFDVPTVIAGKNGEILWDEAYFSIGISDNRGLKGNITLRAGEDSIDAIPGLRENDLFRSGISFPVAHAEGRTGIPFEVRIRISGSESISFTPLGKTTTVTLSSPWNAPGFNGNFLPVERTINETGFTASWIVTNLNRNFPQSWEGNAYNPESDSFGTSFVLEADHYQKSLRSAKYGVLFIALTFLSLLFVELSLKEKINIFHYLLMALGLVLFFSLLNALSEHIGFNLAYLIAGTGTIALIIFFLKAIINKVRPVMMIGGLLIFLYSFTFILLTLKDYAYLAGNIGLFILLAITMRLSLKLRESLS
ncbi:MAG TPA: cell envelope integrity protein CreD [Bacteroidales bacterium]|nr:cell envelope integrity protein CreD [Bacteroidales bacterium]